jgi:hypothetical protein
MCRLDAYPSFFFIRIKDLFIYFFIYLISYIYTHAWQVKCDLALTRVKMYKNVFFFLICVNSDRHELVRLHQ